MEYALDSDRRRISSYNAEKGKEYFCPVCGGKVILKSGDIKIPHFAHETSECTDSWNYDMSEWHKSMQEYFDEEYREVICKKDNQIHRADILKDGVVLELQHSPISTEEFIDRNQFYLSLGYKVAWVFDVDQQFKNGDLYFEDTEDDTLRLRWNYPKQVLKSCPNISDNDNNFALYLSYTHEDEEEAIEKVVWSSKDIYGDYNLKRIIVSNYPYSITKNMNLNDLFISKKDRLCKHLENKKPYIIKKCGEKGHPRDTYVCPRRQEFGLKIFGEKGCRYCKYCGAVEEVNKGQYGKSYNIFCCFPVQVNKENDSSSGLYESNAEMF